MEFIPGNRRLLTLHSQSEGKHTSLAPIVSDLAASLCFGTEILDFGIAYERPRASSSLAQGGAHVILYQRCRFYEKGTMEQPYGRGIMLQIELQDVEAVRDSLCERDWPLYEPMKEAWYRAGQHERGLRQFLVQDPDGYLLMVYEEVGVRPIV